MHPGQHLADFMTQHAGSLCKARRPLPLGDTSAGIVVVGLPIVRLQLLPARHLATAAWLLVPLLVRGLGEAV